MRLFTKSKAEIVIKKELGEIQIKINEEEENRKKC